MLAPKGLTLIYLKQKQLHFFFEVANISGKTPYISELNSMNMSVFSLPEKRVGFTDSHLGFHIPWATSNLYSPRQSFFIILQG